MPDQQPPVPPETPPAAPETPPATLDLKQIHKDLIAPLKEEMLSMSKANQALQAQLAEMAEKFKAPPKPPQPSGQDDMVARLKSEMDEWKAKLEQERKARAEDLLKAQQEKNKAATLAALQKHIPGEGAVNALARMLFDGNLTLNGDVPLLRVENQYGELVDVPLDKGLDSWFSTTVGKTLLPPKPGNGTGGAGPSESRFTSQDTSIENINDPDKLLEVLRKAAENNR